MLCFFIDHSQTVLELLFRFFIEQTLIADLALFDPIFVYGLVDTEPQPVKVPGETQTCQPKSVVEVQARLTRRCCRP